MELCGRYLSLQSCPNKPRLWGRSDEIVGTIKIALDIDISVMLKEIGRHHTDADAKTARASPILLSSLPF